MPESIDKTKALKQKARALGFDACGIAHASALESLRPILQQWLRQGYQGTMGYLANHFEKRIDPRLLVPGAKSVVVVAQNYFPSEEQKEDARYRVSRYAYGEDYHVVLKEKLQKLAAYVEKIAGEHSYRCFTDSAPVMERSWAREAGLGNTGKNTCLIIPGKGSYYFLGELITSAEFHPDTPFKKNLCGTCSRCIEVCPTQAIIAPGKLDATRCISYLTIELKDPVPETYRNKCQGWVFGCDICQEVCPYNRVAIPHNEPRLRPLPHITRWGNKDWENMTESTFYDMFKKRNSPLVRATYPKLKDNILCAREHQGTDK